jgi:acetoin utilization deacetylase AcuC-like enzyme
MSTGLIYSERLLEHDTGPMHPERPDRLRAIVAGLKRSGAWDRLTHLEFGPAERKWIERLHDPAYVDRVYEQCRAGRPYIDTHDSVICEKSAELAQLAVGGGLAAAEAVMKGSVTNAFCAVRPPGHHATRDRAMGFCLFNTTAIATEYLIAQHQLDRVAIVDFDVHHGNGTQSLFEARSDVLFISIHEDPDYLYPGSGYAHERGIGEGLGLRSTCRCHPVPVMRNMTRRCASTYCPRLKHISRNAS